jgi:hypothetical protein
MLDRAQSGSGRSLRPRARFAAHDWVGDLPQARAELDRGRGERVLSPKFSRRLGPNRSSWATIDSSRAIVPTSPAGDGLGDDPVVTIRPAGGAGLRIGFATSIL